MPRLFPVTTKIRHQLAKKTLKAVAFLGKIVKSPKFMWSLYTDWQGIMTWLLYKVGLCIETVYLIKLLKLIQYSGRISNPEFFRTEILSFLRPSNLKFNQPVDPVSGLAFFYSLGPYFCYCIHSSWRVWLFPGVVDYDFLSVQTQSGQTQGCMEMETVAALDSQCYR